MIKSKSIVLSILLKQNILYSKNNLLSLYYTNLKFNSNNNNNNNKNNKESKELIYNKNENLAKEKLTAAEKEIINFNKSTLKKPLLSEKLFKVDNEKLNNSKPDNNDVYTNNSKVYSVEEREKRKAMLLKEASLNPKLFEALPNLKNDLNYSELVEDSNEYLKEVNTDKIKTQKYLKSLAINNLPKRNFNFFSSLLNKHKHGYDIRLNDEKSQDNIDKFISAYTSNTGPKHVINSLHEEEKKTINTKNNILNNITLKEKIHEQIDLKMKELEDSGLSKEEILYNDPKGIPLKQDNFFQFLKNNRNAREMLLESTEELSVESVINKALKQNIGPDPSFAGGKVSYVNSELLPDDYSFMMQSKKFKNKRYQNLEVTDDSYYYKSNYNEKMRLHLNYFKAKPITLIQKPMSRSEKRKKFMIRNISVSDLHWRNLPLMSKFLTSVGNLNSRYQSRLPRQLHKRAVKVIKHLKTIGIFPSNDRIRPTDKIPFNSLHHDFINDMTKMVDPKSGKLITRPIDLSLDDKATYSRYENIKIGFDVNKEEIKYDKFKQALYLDPKSLPDLPPDEIKEYINAQNYQIKLEKNMIDLDNLSDIDLEEKRCYEKYYSKIVNNLDIYSIQDQFLNERSYLIKEILNKRRLETDGNKKQNIKLLSRDISTIKKDINNIIKENNLNDIKYSPRERYMFKKLEDLNLEAKHKNNDFNKFDFNQNEDKYHYVAPIIEPNILNKNISNNFKYNRYKITKDSVEKSYAKYKNNKI